ncbi:MAG: hypothetical protein LC751_00340, partial [Actinobacteria bacterium]|nr:hypothetical protein [Actinomycetota bacterium]
MITASSFLFDVPGPFGRLDLRNSRPSMSATARVRKVLARQKPSLLSLDVPGGRRHGGTFDGLLPLGQEGKPVRDQYVEVECEIQGRHDRI